MPPHRTVAAMPVPTDGEALARIAQALPQTYGLAAEECAAALADAFQRQAGRGAATSAYAADIVLAAAYRRGTPEAVEAFRERFTGMIRFITRNCLSPADALEAEDESWAALWEKLGCYEGRSSLGTWLYVVVRRWCLRRSRQKPPPGPDWSDDEGNGVEDRVASPDPEVGTTVACQAFSAALDRCTLDALRGLTPQERALLRLRFVHHMPLETLRLRPEIYAAGEAVQPVYGITRRVQRAGRRVREGAMALLEGCGYDACVCAHLLQECEQVEGDVARSLMAELSRDGLQVGEAGGSNPARAEAPDTIEIASEVQIGEAAGSNPADP